MINPVPNLAAMAPYQLATLDDSLISLAQNESALPPGTKAAEAAIKALSQSALYPDPDWTELRSAISHVHGLALERIICGAGSMELIGTLLAAYVQPGDAVLGTQYGYLFVDTVCKQIGAQYIRAVETDYTVSVDALLDRLTSATRAVFVCNPGNPTGTRIANSDLLYLRKELPDDCMLIIDQAYAEFDDQPQQQMFELVEHGNTVITRTFSKAYCLAGLRVGWACMPEHVAANVRKLLNPNNVSVVAQQMAAASMLDQPYLQRVVQHISSVRIQSQQSLASHQINTPDSHTNFFLLPLADNVAAQAMDARLKSAGFVVRGMAGYGLADCLRITIGTEEQMGKVCEVIIDGF